jgi:hypothetical protein
MVEYALIYRAQPGSGQNNKHLVLWMEDRMARGKFGGMGGMGGGNMQQLMRQAQKMQEQLAKTQEELDEKEYEAQSGGGMVACKINGKRELVSLTIKPEAVDPEDVEMLEDLVMAAVNEALRLGEQAREQAMASVTGGMGGLL